MPPEEKGAEESVSSKKKEKRKHVDHEEPALLPAPSAARSSDDLEDDPGDRRVLSRYRAPVSSPGRPGRSVAACAQATAAFRREGGLGGRGPCRAPRSSWWLSSEARVCVSGPAAATPAFTRDGALIGLRNRLVRALLPPGVPANHVLSVRPSSSPAQSFAMTHVQHLCFWTEDKSVETLSLSTVPLGVPFGQ